MNLKLDETKVNALLHNILPFFFAIVFIKTINGAFLGYLQHNPWRMGNWLINYQGGIVRRGLSGEVVYQLSLYTKISPGIYVFLLQSLLYTIFLYFSYQLLKRQKSLLPYAFLIFSPFIFTFQIYDVSGGFRKEILYFAILALLIWTAAFKQKQIDRTFYIILLFYPAVILSHEMLVIYLPYILAVYLTATKLTVKKIVTSLILLIPSAISLVIVLNNKGSATQAQEIFNSLSAINYPIAKKSAISWLANDTSFGIESVLAFYRANKYTLISYLLIVGLAFLAYIPVLERLKYIMKNQFSRLLILSGVLASIALFVVALDWGRFIYVHLVSMFLLSLIPIQDIEERKQQPHNQSINISIIIALVMYALFWNIHHFISGNAVFIHARPNIVHFLCECYL